MSLVNKESQAPARRALRALALVSAFFMTAQQATGQEVVGDACTAERLLKAEAAMATELSTLPNRYPWLKSASLVCNGLAMGSPAEQTAMLSACVARACTAGSSAGSCSADSANVLEAVSSSARRRAGLRQDATRCRGPMEDAASRDPLATLFLLQLAMSHGDAATVRRYSIGSDDDFAKLKPLLAIPGAVEDYMRQAAASRGSAAAEFAWLEFVGSVRQRPPVDRNRLRLTVDGDTAEVASPDLPSTGHFRRVGGTWKNDLAGANVNPATSTPDAEIYAQLLLSGYKRATELLRDGRIAWPATAISAVQGCLMTGALMARASVDNGVGYCKTFIERRYPASEGSQDSRETTARDARGGSARPASSDTKALQSLVESAFQRWSRQWWTDRYVPASALVGEPQCAATSCEVAGQFTVVRMGQSIQVPFSATLTKRPDGFVLSRLCYDDSATSGMQDCAR